MQSFGCLHRGAFDVDVAQQHFVFQSKDYFQHTRTASSCLQMANVALDATDSNLFFEQPTSFVLKTFCKAVNSICPQLECQYHDLRPMLLSLGQAWRCSSASDGELLATYRRGIYPRAFAITTGCNSRNTAWILSPSRSASARRFMTNITLPSPNNFVSF